MEIELFYLGNRDKEGCLTCYCKDGQWRSYKDCETDWTQVVTFPIKEIYELKNSLLTDDDRCGFTDCNIHVRSNTRQRSIYVLLKFDDTLDRWCVKSKCLADSYSGACKTFGVDYDIAQSSFETRVSHYHDLSSYGDVVREVDALKNLL